MTVTFSLLPQEVVRLVMNHINDLPDLYQCTLVNTYFYAVAIPKLWHSPKSMVNSDSLFDTAPLLKSLSTNPHLGAHVRQLEFSAEETVSAILMVLAHTPLVSDLALCQTVMSDTDMARIAHLCSGLRRLSLVSVDGVTDAALRAHGGVTELELFWCHQLTFLPACLERLDIRGGRALSQTIDGPLDRLTYLSICSVDDDALACFIDRLLLFTLPSLTSFLINCYGCKETKLEDRAMVPFIKAHPRLKMLSLGHAWIGHGSLAAMAKRLVGLETLYLDHNRALSFLDLHSVILGCPLLNYISLYMCRLSDTDKKVDELDRHDIEQLRMVLDKDS